MIRMTQLLLFRIAYITILQPHATKISKSLLFDKQRVNVKLQLEEVSVFPTGVRLSYPNYYNNLASDN